MRLILVLLAAGCVADLTTTNQSPGRPNATPPPPPCTNTVQSMTPTQDEDDVYYRVKIRATLAEVDYQTQIKVTGPKGIVSGNLVVDGTEVTWSPARPLSPMTKYGVEVQHACGSEEASWTTGEVGGKLQVDVTNTVYAVDLQSGLWRQPVGGLDLVDELLTDRSFLWMPTQTKPNLQILSADDDGTQAQDVCLQTHSFRSIGFDESPFFQFADADVEITQGDLQVYFDDVAFAGSFAPDGSRIQGLELSGILDTRTLIKTLGLAGPDAICNQLAQDGGACIACEDGEGEFCARFEVEAIDAVALPKGSPALVERNLADIVADKGCGG